MSKISKVSRIIFFVLLGIAGLGVFLSVGSLLDISNPVAVLVISLTFAGILGLGYFLGTRDPKFFIEVPVEQQEENDE